MKKARKMEVKMTAEAFLQYSYRVINSCKFPNQAHVAYAFLIDRANCLKFKPEDDERVRDIVEFLFLEKINKIGFPLSSAWYCQTGK
jgi:hypothetical protein